MSAASRYQQLHEIGQGRFGSVYLCQDAAGRLLVMKKVNASCVDAPARVEARAMLKLRKHPNIIDLRDIFDDGPDHLALVMEYADGGDLASRIADAKNKGAGIKFSEVIHIKSKNPPKNFFPKLSQTFPMVRKRYSHFPTVTLISP